MYLEMDQHPMVLNWINDTHSGRFVFTTRDTIRPIFAQLQIRHNIPVCPLIVVQFFTTLHIEQRNLSRLMTSENDVRYISERADGRFRSNRVEEIKWIEGFFKSLSNHHLVLKRCENTKWLTVGTISVPIDVEDANRALETHTLLSDANDLCPIVVECYPLNSSGELPRIKVFSCLDRPKS
jgi:hypothetical protein